MLKEIYCRPSDDPNANEFILEHSNVYETLLGKLRLILMTERGSVLGDPFFGSSLETFIFETRVPASEIENDIKTQIATYISEASLFDIKVKVSLQKGVTNDTGVVDIIVNGSKALGIIVK